MCGCANVRMCEWYHYETFHSHFIPRHYQFANLQIHLMTFLVIIVILALILTI